VLGLSKRQLSKRQIKQQPVLIIINGANPATKIITTDNSGQASLAITATNPGLDGIQAEAGVNGMPIFSKLVKVTWTPISNPPPPPLVAYPVLAVRLRQVG